MCQKNAKERERSGAKIDYKLSLGGNRYCLHRHIKGLSDKPYKREHLIGKCFVSILCVTG